MQYQRIEIALNQLKDHLVKIGHYEQQNGTEVKSRQNGTIRVNCVDSLDRTGVLISALIRTKLQQWLIECSMLRENEQWDAGFENYLRNSFADASDMLSMQYSGAPAMKTEYTRTGQRTQLGAIQDFVNASKRKFYSLTTDPTVEVIL